MVSESDRSLVTELLGRDPQGEFEIVVRSKQGSPVVIKNSPILDSGQPMPTMYWLIDPKLVKAIGTLESAGAVNLVEAQLGLEKIAEVHNLYRQQREALIPESHSGHKPSGGVGGTRKGVKCLHAHYANYLVDREDIVGVWVHEQLKKTGDHFQFDSSEGGAK